MFVGPSRSPFVNIPEKEKSAWRLPNGFGGSYHASTDASLFSTSLPVLPQVKCIGIVAANLIIVILVIVK